MSSMIFHEGRPCAPINSPEIERAMVAQVRRFCAERGSTPPDEGSLRVGFRNGWLSGWHAGFAAAIAIEAATAGETCNRLGPKGESAGLKGIAQKKPGDRPPTFPNTAAQKDSPDV